MTGLTMVHIVGGRIAESWVKNDIAGLMNQIGPAPRPGRAYVSLLERK